MKTVETENECPLYHCGGKIVIGFTESVSMNGLGPSSRRKVSVVYCKKCLVRFLDVPGRKKGMAQEIVNRVITRKN